VGLCIKSLNLQPKFIGLPEIIMIKDSDIFATGEIESPVSDTARPLLL